METSLSPELVPVKDRVWQKISDLQAALQANDPKLAGHCKAIHTELSQYEELVHLLTDDQIREIIAAQTVVTGTMLVQKVTKEKNTSTSVKKAAKYSSIDEL